MKIYSPNIHLFAKRCENYLKNILTDEVGAVVGRTRFTLDNVSSPITVVIFESKNTLGYFDPHTFQIALNKKLMLGIKEQTLKDILRHELAHYLCFLSYRNDFAPHGEEFKQVCSLYNWDKSVSKAHIDIDLTDENIEGDLRAEKLKTKFQALLKLASSDNIHEAELATIKANQMLLKYNLELSQDSEELIYADILLTFKKKSAKMIAIYDIISTFMVKPILIYGHKQVALEACGSKTNIELAQYIAHFLNQEFERLWEKNKSISLKGMRAKNSFFKGIAAGYLEKNELSLRQLDKESQNALIALSKTRDINMNLIYKRTSSSRSQNTIDSSAMAQGKIAGKNLSINQAIKNTKKKLFLQMRS